MSQCTAHVRFRGQSGHGLVHRTCCISEARRERLVMADGIVPAIIWVVLFGGAFRTIGFTFFFGAENLRAQVLMTGALSVLIFAGLLTVVAIVGPEALAAVVKDFAGAPPQRSALAAAASRQRRHSISSMAYQSSPQE